MRSAMRHRLLCWGFPLVVAMGGNIAAAQSVSPSDLRTFLEPMAIRSSSGNWSHQVHRIFFPPDPPPLGAQINIDPHRNWTLSGAPSELAHFVNEPFYAPLSTCLTEFTPATQRKFRPRIDAFRVARDRLLDELRTGLAEHSRDRTEERGAAFAAIAERQSKALHALEAEAESLRVALADRVSWYDRRQWKLDAGNLRPLRPEHRVLEFQLVRAAAFYQPGLLPAQRRLLRESAMLMQDEMFAREPEWATTVDGVSSPPANPRLLFFSPDLVRLLPATGMPPAVLELLHTFIAEKDALRDELTAAVLAEDKVRFSSSRRRALEALARAQAPRLALLDTRAEEIRRAYAPAFAQRRPVRPYALPPEVATTIDRFLDDRTRFLGSLEARIRRAQWRVRTEYAGGDAAELRELEAKEAQRIIDHFSRDRAAELVDFDQRLHRIHGMLAACVGERAIIPTGPSPDAFLVEFMARYRQAWAYYEYEIAVFEPGFSPAQRRLLFGGAIRRLELPLPRAEWQPTALPLTFLKDGKPVR